MTNPTNTPFPSFFDPKQNPFSAIAGAFAAPMLAMFGSGLNQMAGSLLNNPAVTMMQGRIDPAKFLEISQRYSVELAQTWSKMVQESGKPDSKPSIEIKDRRFSSEAWMSSSVSAYTAAVYLIQARYLMELADNVQADARTRERIQFAVQQWVDAAAPSNFLALNPEAQRRAIETGGESLMRGLENLLHDLNQGKVTMTDESVFELGRNIATTKGKVVFQNELFQLLQYEPLTDKVHKLPFLFVPPSINKFYILDLQPENSIVRWLNEQGHTVFLVSWINPGKQQEQLTWDDYVEKGAIKAIEVTKAIGGQPQINVMGFCVGGTILSTALAVLAARADKSVKSMSLFTSLLDFSSNGVLDVFISEDMVKQREETLGKGGLMLGKDMANTFSFLRPNDLVWNYVVGNYLKGETPPPFDLLYWNSDSTNMPGPMYAWYLRHTYLENKLCKPNAVKVANEPVDLSAIKLPAFIYASYEDHIVPWKSAYASMNVLSGEKTFVLGASGHIAGVINPPSKNKRHYWSNPKVVKNADDWFAQAKQEPGSWWPVWGEWLAKQAGPMVAARKKLGNATYKPLEDAPGSYVKVKH